jgi:hypothetical protein
MKSWQPIAFTDMKYLLDLDFTIHGRELMDDYNAVWLNLSR